MEWHGSFFERILKIMHGSTDLTIGRPRQQIIFFSLPLVFGTVFQQLYSFIDSIIVGRLISSEALGSVGATYSLSFLIIGFVQGFCVGLGIPIAQSFGAHHTKDIQRYFWNSVYLCIIISTVFGFGMTILTPILLTIMHTPQQLLPAAIAFIQPQFAWIGITVLYNFSASVLRAFGDSKHPFYFLVGASLLNILLDLFFVGNLKLGVRGAAYATLIAQFISGLANIFWLVTKINMIKFKKEYLAFSSHYFYRLIYISVPMGLEYSISAIGAIIMQLAINALGPQVVIAQTAGEKIRQMFTLPMESVGMGMATFISQNYGAKKIQRIRQGIHDGVTIQVGYCIFCIAVIMLSATPLSYLVIGKNQHLIQLSARYLRLMSLTFFFHGSLMIYRNTLQGLGFSIEAVLSGVGELIGRSCGSLIAIVLMSFTAVCFINPVAWSLSLLYCYWMVNRKLANITTSLTSDQRRL